MENIKTNRLILRKPQESDAGLLFPLLNDKLIGEYIPHLSSQSSSEIKDFLYYARTLCDYKTDFCVMIEESESKDIVGLMEAFVLSNNTISISYAIKKRARGNGYMPEALRAFIQYLKNDTDIQAVEFSIRYNNSSSISIMEKLSIPFFKTAGTYIHYRLSLKEELPW